mgnify:CR=1 FL=1
MKQRLLITIGDSWTYGVGNLHPDLFKENMSGIEIYDFHSNPLQFEYELNNAWGSWVSNELGFDDWINFATPGSSLESIWRCFLDIHPITTFKDWEVYVIIMNPYFSRISLPVKVGKLGTIGTDTKLYEEWVKYVVNSSSDDINEVVNHNSATILREIIFKLNEFGFKTVLGFNDKNDEDYFRKEYTQISNELLILNRPFSDGFFQGYDVPKNWITPYDGHLNKDGYEFVANHIITQIKNAKMLSWISTPRESRKWSCPVRWQSDSNYPLANLVLNKNVSLTNKLI